MSQQQKISLNIGKAIKKFNNLTPFEKKVLRVTCSIKPGQVRTYKWLAERIGRPKAARAVGGALKKNPLPLLIPCHRVINRQGKLSGYNLGKNLKKQILQFEKMFINYQTAKRNPPIDLSNYCNFLILIWLCLYLRLF